MHIVFSVYSRKMKMEIRRLVKRSSACTVLKNFDIIFGAVLGGALFCGIYDIAWLNPLHWGWCMPIDDSAQHCLGGMFFCRDEWRWPLGLFYGINGDFPHLISFVDGIPVAAFAAKLFCSFFSVSPFIQYLGITYLINFILQGVFAVLLMRHASSRLFFRVCGITMILLCPCFLLEIPDHCALTAQWLILWALLLWVSDSEKTCRQWLVLLCLSLWIHPYFTGICSALGIAFFIQHFQRSKINSYCLNAGIFGAVLGITAYLLGFFSVAVQPGGGSAFIASINLNGFINSHNPQYSALIGPLPHSPLNPCVYAGAGFLLLAITGTPMLWDHCRKEYVKQKYGMLFLVLLVFLLFSLGNYIRLGNQIVFSVIFPPWLYRLCSVFRANYRFFWPIWYFFLWSLWLVIDRCEKKKIAVVIAGVVLLIQCYDLGGGLLAHTWAYYFSRKDEKTPDVYRQIPVSGCKQPIRQIVYDYSPDLFREPSICALVCRTRVNTFYYARDIQVSEPKDSVSLLLERGPVKGHLYFLTEKQRQNLSVKFPELSGRIVPYKKYFLLLPEK